MVHIYSPKPIEKSIFADIRPDCKKEQDLFVFIMSGMVGIQLV